ncbi:hypothetical protein U9M48_030610 [Paspalum notatum var. saurae]|uniref:Reverse transcriptase zinc-binding domain-containing protein n=1 Tax=Paspalum notatum var. saurae TaxID=547442 RepID=A0AAQ3U1A7_PASNO
MTADHLLIKIIKGGNEIPPSSDGGIGVKELGNSITKLDPFDGSPSDQKWRISWPGIMTRRACSLLNQPIMSYNVGRSRVKQIGESSSHLRYSKELNWSVVWNLNFQLKIKHFLWRLAKNSLPWRKNIQRRGMQIDTRCPVCWRLDEDGGIFKYVKHVWLTMDLEHIRTRLLLATSANQMVKMVLDLKEEDLRRTVGLLWSWWEARNKANVGENRKSTTDVVYRAARLANDACHLEKASANQPRK